MAGLNRNRTSQVWIIYAPLVNTKPLSSYALEMNLRMEEIRLAFALNAIIHYIMNRKEICAMTIFKSSPLRCFNKIYLHVQKPQLKHCFRLRSAFSCVGRIST
mmetsp:Transcript_10320/g.15331  ORF Transcript_10320/g.15331 Transcript_10320/m.15331 type:complete len:103 (-) Transcript_10320:438-746(-)